LAGRIEELIMKKRTTENEFVEAIQFDKECSVLISGTFIDKIPRNDRNYKNNIGRWYKPFFYLYVKKMLESGGVSLYLFSENTSLCGIKKISGVFLRENSDLLNICIFQVLCFLFLLL